MTENQKIGATVAGVGLLIVGVAVAAHVAGQKPTWPRLQIGDPMQAIQAKIPEGSVHGSLIGGGEIGSTG